MEIIWRTAMSMDGRIATAEQDLGFLETIQDQEAALADFPAFVASVDAIILGATTLRWLVRQGHGWPHGDKPTYLVSHDAALATAVTSQLPLRRVEGDLRGLVEGLEASGAKRVWLCGGGDVAGQLLALGRIDEVEVTIAPVALGSGPALFDHPSLALRPFRLVACETCAGNAVRIRWRRERGP
ncbi:MAG: dihydrofolate reductase family protein [Myxococcales bacterium]